MIYLLLIHWFCDFYLQTRWQAHNKSHNIIALYNHVIVYSTVMTILLMPVLGWNAFCFGGITLIAHFTTDYFTSRLNAYLWGMREFHTNKEISERYEHRFWTSIGFDQFLHVTQLILTYKLLNNEF